MKSAMLIGGKMGGIEREWLSDNHVNAGDR